MISALKGPIAVAAIILLALTFVWDSLIVLTLALILAVLGILVAGISIGEALDERRSRQ